MKINVGHNLDATSNNTFSKWKKEKQQSKTSTGKPVFL
jgi:hypothetical protein